MQSDKIKNTEEKAEKTEVCEVASEGMGYKVLSAEAEKVPSNYTTQLFTDLSAPFPIG